MAKEEEWWVTEYAPDIYLHLLSKEAKRETFQGKSPLLHLRKTIIKWVCNVADKKGLSTPVKHLCVYLLDFFMDKHFIEKKHLQLVGLSCILVAAKLEENDNLIPRASELNVLVDNYYKLKNYIQMELMILTFFRWDIMTPTAAHFADYLMPYASTSAWDIEPPKTDENLQICVAHFLELSLKDTIFYEFPASKVGASCVMAARVFLGMNPFWTKTLEFYSKYFTEELVPIVNLLLRQE